MDIKTLYKVVSGDSPEVEHTLNSLSRDGWRLVTMSCRSSVLTVILENKILEETKPNLSRALADDTSKEITLEEVQ